jgi:hypothetical protein
MVVEDLAMFVLQVLPEPDGDLQELSDLAGGLYAELSETDAVSVAALTRGALPDRAKGLGVAAGWLVVNFGTLAGLRAALATVRGWAGRTGQSVEVGIGGDILKVTGASSAQQQQIIDAWLARHSPDA